MSKVLVTRVDFAVPMVHGTVGDRFPSWDEAVKAARDSIQRHEYKGQVVRPGSDDFHPRRHFQEFDTLVVYSRAFVHMRVTERMTRPVRARAGRDYVAATWEVFHDGAVEGEGE